MKLSTKAVASLLVITSVAAAIPGVSKYVTPKRKHESQFDRLLQRHDRKGELRAEILGISVHELKTLSKTKTFDQIVSHTGMGSTRTFRLALLGYLRNELKQRGWSAARIDSYVLVRVPRFA